MKEELEVEEKEGLWKSFQGEWENIWSREICYEFKEYQETSWDLIIMLYTKEWLFLSINYIIITSGIKSHHL